MGEQLYFNPRYGVAGTSCNEHPCCYAGMQDLYCYSADSGRPSSGLYFTRSCSVNTKEYPDNGAVLDGQWGYQREGSHASREMFLSKAAWEDAIVCQLEYCGGGLSRTITGAAADRYSQDYPVVRLPLQVPSRDLSENPRMRTAHWFIHSGAFEVRTHESPVHSLQIVPLEPLSGIVSTQANSRATFDAKLSDSRVVTSFRNDENFSRMAILCRHADPDNCIGVVVQKDPPLFMIQEVVDGVTNTIASEAITEDRVFSPGNYHAAINDSSNAFTAGNDYSTVKNLEIILNDTTITAKLTQIVRHFDGESDEDVSITISGDSNVGINETRYGIWAETDEVAFGSIVVDQLAANIPHSFDCKFFVSLYDDSVPEQVAEFDVTSHFAALMDDFENGVGAGILLGSSTMGAIVAGGTKALWLHKGAPDEDHPEFELPCPRWKNDCAYQLALDSVDPNIILGTPAIVFSKSGSSWSSEEFAPFSEVQEYDSGNSTFEAHPFELAYRGLPVFAQHSYPLAVGYRMTGVSAEETSGGSYNFTVTHEFYAGEVIWPLDGSLPYVDDSDLTILYSIEEIREFFAGASDPTEDGIRQAASLYLHPGSSSTVAEYFEADPDLGAFALGWGETFFEPLGNRLGIAKVLEGTPATYSFNLSGSMFNTTASAAVAPGGKLAISETYWSELPGGVPADTFDLFGYDSYRLSLYSPSGQELEIITSTDVANYPPRIQQAGGSQTAKLYHGILACSDEYIYVTSPAMDQQEKSQFCGHSLPYINHSQTPNDTWRNQTSWLISWDGTVRIPAIWKAAYEPEYRTRDTFGADSLFNFFSAGLSRKVQAYDCIKDSTLPFAPNYTLSEEDEVPFTCVFDGFYRHTTITEEFFAGIPYPGTTLSKLFVDPVVWTVPDGCTEITVECWGAGGGGASGFDSEPSFFDIGIESPVDHAQFLVPGAFTWTCPANVTGAVVECIGAGGSGSSDFAGGGGAYVLSWFDVVPGENYDVFIASGEPETTYFVNEQTIRASSGEDATASEAGGGGDKTNCLGTHVSEGDIGLGDSPGSAGGIFYTDAISSDIGDGSGPDGDGNDGGVQISWRVGIAGNGGGGGGGYARSVLAVTPGEEYDIQVGSGGIGQNAIPDDLLVISQSPLYHGESSWFGNIDLVRAAGGDSAGISYDESVSESEDNAWFGLIDGALGGGQPESNAENIGDVTFPGGNGGDGNGISKAFGFVGGGGGGVAGRRGAGENGFDGKDGGGRGHSSNDFDFVFFSTFRYGSGGNGGVFGEGVNQFVTIGTEPGGGASGRALHAFSSATYPSPSIGPPGRVVVSGVKTGKILLPSFW